MPRRRATKPADLRLRPVNGLLEDVALAVPVDWVATLRAQAGKLNLPLEEMLVQFIGHLSHESEGAGRSGPGPTYRRCRGAIPPGWLVSEIIRA